MSQNEIEISLEKDDKENSNSINSIEFEPIKTSELNVSFFSNDKFNLIKERKNHIKKNSNSTSSINSIKKGLVKSLCTSGRRSGFAGQNEYKKEICRC